jgi:tetratricopeptide (TPR) repeat protein
MSKYDIDLDYAIFDVDITEEELEEIKAEANKIISENKESKENLAMAYLKKAQCLQKLGSCRISRYPFLDEISFIFIYEEMGIIIKRKDIKRLLKKALELSPDMPEALMQLGFLKYNDYYDKIEEIKGTINLFNRAIQLKPDYAAAYNNRAMIFYHLLYHSISTDNQQEKDDFEKDKRSHYINAVADLTEAIRIRPFDAVYHVSRGVFHSKLGEHKKAVEDFSKAINYASDELKNKLITDVLVFRGKEYLELNEYAKAIDDFSESLRLNPKDDDILLLRAKAYYFLDEKEKTKVVIEGYLKRKHDEAYTNSRKEIYELTGLNPEDIL